MITNKKKVQITLKSSSNKNLFDKIRKLQCQERGNKQCLKVRKKEQSQGKKSNLSRKKLGELDVKGNNKKRRRKLGVNQGIEKKNVCSTRKSKRKQEKERSSQKKYKIEKSRNKQRVNKIAEIKKHQNYKTNLFDRLKQPNDEYYGKKEQFMCVANTQQTLNDSQAFFNKYTRLVNKIKNIQIYHKQEYKQLKNKVMQHELSRLIKIQSLEKRREQNNLMRFIQKN